MGAVTKYHSSSFSWIHDCDRDPRPSSLLRLIPQSTTRLQQGAGHITSQVYPIRTREGIPTTRLTNIHYHRRSGVKRWIAVRAPFFTLPSKSTWTYSPDRLLIRQKQISQFDEYFDDLHVDLTSASSADRKPLDDPLQWWLEVGCGKYPIIFKMACDYLTIPATSRECERACSGVRGTITCDRNSLSSDTISKTRGRRQASQLCEGSLRVTQTL